MNKEKISYLAHLGVTVIVALILSFLFFRYLFLAVLPFLIAWAAAFILRPAVNFIHRKTHIPQKAVSVALTILCVALGLGLISLLVFFALKEAWEIFSSLAANRVIIEAFARLTRPLGSLFGDNAQNGAITEQIANAIKEGMSGVVAALVSALTAIVSSVPRVLFFILVTVIASVYFALDLDRVNSFVKSVLPDKLCQRLIKFKNGCLSVGGKYIRSYLVIMCITFFIMLCGFMILRVKNLLFIAVIISLLDFLPIIGVGTILVPWSIVELALGNTGTAVGLLVLLVFHELVRQFAEPKIIGKNLGVHPLISLLLLYVGYSAFGFVGLLLVPILAVVLNVVISKSKSENQATDVD